ncbi:DUF1569 domain-containing protein [Leptospira sp. 96542]|nr:DUF1569 domain-containing protein [Leptospira sp. 96542]
MKRSTFLKRTFLLLGVLGMPIKSEPISDSDWKTLISDADSLSDWESLITKIQEGSIVLKTDSQWSLGKIFSHCAQSIEYSMNGYPEMKSAIFRVSVGKIAFSVFAFKNQMNHGLEEPIPGAVSLEDPINIKTGTKRLLQSIDTFQSTSESNLKAHFAYGELTKEEYDLAHSLHIKNHFDRIFLKV